MIEVCLTEGGAPVGCPGPAVIIEQRSPRLEPREGVSGLGLAARSATAGNRRSTGIPTPRNTVEFPAVVSVLVASTVQQRVTVLPIVSRLGRIGAAGADASVIVVDARRSVGFRWTFNDDVTATVSVAWIASPGRGRGRRASTGVRKLRDRRRVIGALRTSGNIVATAVAARRGTKFIVRQRHSLADTTLLTDTLTPCKSLWIDALTRRRGRAAAPIDTRTQETPVTRRRRTASLAVGVTAIRRATLVAAVILD